MDLSYPHDAEDFRVEIRAWLEEHLPDGWFDEGFEMSDEERKRFNREWPQQLFEGCLLYTSDAADERVRV